MKYLIGAICAIVISPAFSGRKCDHVFTQVEQPTVKIERPFQGAIAVFPEQIYSWPTGTMDGKDIICVKCFHRQKQLLDYGQPDNSGVTFGTICGDTLFMPLGEIKFDSTRIISCK